MIQTNNPAHPNLPNEKSVTVDGDGDRVNIHPWLSGINNRDESEVYISVGDDNSMSRDGIVTGEAVSIAIVNREEFVEAILAVFPELARA